VKTVILDVCAPADSVADFVRVCIMRDVVRGDVRGDVVSHVDLLPSRNSGDTILISARCPTGKHRGL
jgi:hypothetical protein